MLACALPLYCPFFLAIAIPSAYLSNKTSRSNSFKAEMIVKNSFPEGIFVSIFSFCGSNVIPFICMLSSTKCNKSFFYLLNLENDSTTIVSPSLAKSKITLSCALSICFPVALSAYTLSIFNFLTIINSYIICTKTGEEILLFQTFLCILNLAACPSFYIAIKTIQLSTK